jgi:hypothetical protein
MQENARTEAGETDPPSFYVWKTEYWEHHNQNLVFTFY